MRSRPLRLLLRIPRLLLLLGRTGILLLRRRILLSCASSRLRIRRLRQYLLKRKAPMGKSSPLSEEDILRQVETPEDPASGSGSIPSSSSRIEDGEEDDDGFDAASLEELTEIAEELADLPFELWHAFRAEIPTLSPFERRFFGKRLSRIIKRRGWDEYATDEIQLLIGGGIAILRRIRIPRPAAVKKEKDHAHDDHRPAGGGKDDVAQSGGPHSPFAV